MDQPAATYPGREEMIHARLEALRLVKDWSSGAIIIQTAAIGAAGALLDEPPVGWRLSLVLLLAAVLIVSIYIGAVGVAGTVPYIVQNVPYRPEADIYQQKGGIAHSWREQPTLGQLCIWQARLFTLSVILFAVFMVFRH